MITPHSNKRRNAAGAVMLVALSLLFGGCAQEPEAPSTPERTSSVDPETAKQQMIDAVDDITEQFGGEWKQGTGPDYADSCALPDGQPGAQWVDVRTRPSVGDVSADLAKVETQWREQGMTIERWGSEAHPTVVGRGGAVTDSISFEVTDGQYGIQALSRCFPGDPDAL
jgi:hypothetical protein